MKIRHIDPTLPNYVDIGMLQWNEHHAGQEFIKRLPRLKFYLDGQEMHRVIAARRSFDSGEDSYGFVTVLERDHRMFDWNRTKKMTYYGLVRFVDPETVDLAEVYLK